MATKPKTRPVRAANARGKDNSAIFNAKSNVANKLMDKAFKDGKPRPGTSVASRVANKAAAWNLYEQASKALKEQRLAKDSGKRMARAQAAAKAKRAK